MNQFKPAVNRGITMGILWIASFAIIYAIDPMIYTSIKGMLIQLGVNFLAIPIVFQTLGARDCKPNFKKYTFGKAFNAAFFTGLVAAVMMLVFNIIFMNFIDPTYQDRIMEETRENMVERLEGAGMDEDQIETTMEKFDERVKEQPKGFKQHLMSTGVMLAWFAVLALIIGAVQRHKEGETNEDDVIIPDTSES